MGNWNILVDERGDVNVISIILLIAIVVVLIIAFMIF